MKPLLISPSIDQSEGLLTAVASTGLAATVASAGLLASVPTLSAEETQLQIDDKLNNLLNEETPINVDGNGPELEMNSLDNSLKEDSEKLSQKEEENPE